MEEMKLDDGDSHSSSSVSGHKRKQKQARNAKSSRSKNASKLNRTEKSESDSDTSNIGLTGKETKHKNEDEKRMEQRRAANRRSACKSRQRQKNLVVDLQKTVADMFKDTTKLRNSNKELQEKLDQVLLENEHLKEQLLSASQGSEDATASQMMNQNATTEPAMVAPAQTLGNLGVACAQNSASDGLEAIGRAASAQNPAGMGARQMNDIIRLMELGALNRSIFSAQETQGPAAAPPQPQWTQRLQMESVENSGRIDPNNLQAQQLQEALRVSSDSQIGGQNALLQNTLQQTQLQRVPSGNEVDSGRINLNDLRVQQLLAALQQSSQNNTSGLNRTL